MSRRNNSFSSTPCCGVCVLSVRVFEKGIFSWMNKVIIYYLLGFPDIVKVPYNRLRLVLGHPLVLDDPL